MKEVWADGVGEGNSRGLERLEQGPGGGKAWGGLGKSHWFWLEDSAVDREGGVGGRLRERGREGELPRVKDGVIWRGGLA